MPGPAALVVVEIRTFQTGVLPSTLGYRAVRLEQIAAVAAAEGFILAPDILAAMVDCREVAAEAAVVLLDTPLMAVPVVFNFPTGLVLLEVAAEEVVAVLIFMSLVIRTCMNIRVLVGTAAAPLSLGQGQTALAEQQAPVPTLEPSMGQVGGTVEIAHRMLALVEVGKERSARSMKTPELYLIGPQAETVLERLALSVSSGALAVAIRQTPQTSN